MEPTASDEAQWPPAIFHEVPAGRSLPGTAVRRFELVDVAGSGDRPVASVLVEIGGPTWHVVEGAAASSRLARRVFLDLLAVADQDGAERVVIDAARAGDLVEAAVASGGVARGAHVVLDL